MGQNLYKNWLLVSKIIWGIWITLGKQWKVQKVAFIGLHLSKKSFLQLKHYIQRIYLTLLSTNCMKIHQIPYVIFETKRTKNHTTQLLCIFSAQALHTFYKSSLQCKLSDFPLLALKFTKFIMSFLEPRVSFFSNFA